MDDKNALAIVGKTAIVPYPVSRLSAPFAPIDQALVLAESDKMLGAVARGQLQLLVEQISFLQEKARAIIAEVEINRHLHRVSCLFQKRPGHTYHLYLKTPEDPESEYFSMLSPEEWGVPPHQFLGSFKLNDDFSWTRVQNA